MGAWVQEAEYFHNKRAVIAHKKVQVRGIKPESQHPRSKEQKQYKMELNTWHSKDKKEKRDYLNRITALIKGWETGDEWDTGESNQDDQLDRRSESAPDTKEN